MPNGGAPAPQAQPGGQAQPEVTEEVEGVLQFEGKGNGYLRDAKRSYLPQPFDVEVPRWLIDRMHLQAGLLVKGQATTRNMKRVLARIDELEGTDPIAVARRTHFQNLTATDPTEKLVMETRADEMIGRVLDLVAPIGLGARGLITSPPKAGKTIMLQRIAQATISSRPDVHLTVLLVDERPEEVTDMKRNIQGEVIGSSNDRPTEEHIHVAEMVLERSKRLVEGGKDVVICSTRSRASRALTTRRSSRPAARSPAASLARARAAEAALRLGPQGRGGRLAHDHRDRAHRHRLADGRGHLRGVQGHGQHGGRALRASSRSAASSRPSTSAPPARARREALLAEEIEKVRRLRGALASLKPVEAMERLLKKLSEFETNEEFLQSF